MYSDKLVLSLIPLAAPCHIVYNTVRTYYIAGRGLSDVFRAHVLVTLAISILLR